MLREHSLSREAGEGWGGGAANLTSLKLTSHKLSSHKLASLKLTLINHARLKPTPQPRPVQVPSDEHDPAHPRLTHLSTAR